MKGADAVKPTDLTPHYLNLFESAALKPAIDLTGLGSMKLGKSPAGVATTPKFESAVYGAGGVIKKPGGMVLTAKHPNNQDNVASRLVYALSSTQFKSAKRMVAEVVFDHPDAVLNTGKPALDQWAVALNFKTGNHNDGSTDVRVGPTCQFLNGGDVRLGMVVHRIDPLESHTYKHYRTQKATFRFSLYVERTNATSVAGGALDIDGVTDSSDLSNLPPNLSGITSANAFTAVGIAIVTPGVNDPLKVPTVSARLRSFALWIYP